MTTGTCSACPEGYYPNSDLSTCLACPDVSKMTAELSTTLGAPAACQCKKGLGYVSTPLGGTCVNSPALQTAMGAYGSSPGSVRLAVIRVFKINLILIERIFYSIRPIQLLLFICRYKL